MRDKADVKCEDGHLIITKQYEVCQGVFFRKFPKVESKMLVWGLHQQDISL